MSSPPVVFVHEFISGGGWPRDEIPQGLVAEGIAMLWAVLSDFRAWGEVRTITTIDDRIENQIERLSPGKIPADEVVRVHAAQYMAVYRALLDRCKVVLIIAPETDGVLAKLTRIAETAGAKLLGCNSESVRVTGDKEVCYRLLHDAAIPIPQTQMTTFPNAPQVAAELGYPLVTKPIDGVGCEGVCLVKDSSELARALQILRKTTSHNQILLQPYIHGVHASVSMLVAQNRAVALSLNRQLIEEGYPFRYLGGTIPLEHPAAETALELARLAALTVQGLRGYVGVDLILAEERPYVIEINPRLTTSYVGLHQVIQQNLARMIWEACLDDFLPEHTPLSGKITFFKGDLMLQPIEREAKKVPRMEVR